MLLKHLRAVIDRTKLCLQNPRSRRIRMRCMTASVDRHQLLHLLILLSHHSVPVCIMLRSLVTDLGYQRDFHFYVLMVEHLVLVIFRCKMSIDTFLSYKFCLFNLHAFMSQHNSWLTQLWQHLFSEICFDFMLTPVAVVFIICSNVKCV
jgi:hypothetical protein